MEEAPKLVTLIWPKLALNKCRCMLDSLTHLLHSISFFSYSASNFLLLLWAKSSLTLTLKHLRDMGLLNLQIMSKLIEQYLKWMAKFCWENQLKFLLLISKQKTSLNNPNRMKTNYWFGRSFMLNSILLLTIQQSKQSISVKFKKLLVIKTLLKSPTWSKVFKQFVPSPISKLRSHSNYFQ